jgi:hypothetical protein
VAEGACVHDEGSVSGETRVSTKRRARVRPSWTASCARRMGERLEVGLGVGFGCESVGDMLVFGIAGYGERVES